MAQSRQLAAIMFTDIVGYTALMERDEKRAFEVLKKNLSIHQSVLDTFHGRLIKELGDGILASFPTVTDALNAAIDIQRQCNDANDYKLSIGIHQGEVVLENGDVFGDAVNVSSRIQSLGTAGSILFSKKIADEIKNKVEFKTVSIGRFEFKNIDETIEVYALASDGFAIPRRDLMQGKLKASFPRHRVLATISIFLLVASGLVIYKSFLSSNNMAIDKSIAVLPFENLSNDPEQEYFSNGITEDILNHLVKIADLRVKSRTSTLQYKGKQPSITQVGEDLGVANIVEGSVRRVGDKVRIVVQLIDAKSDVHLWSETYDREFKDVLALQSEIAIKIANALEARLTSVEKKNIQKISQDVTAYDYFLRARDLTNKTFFEKQDFEKALLLVNQAIQLDSTFAPAYALKGRIWYALADFGIIQKMWQDSALFYSSKAISLDPSLPDGYLLQGRVNRALGNIKVYKTAFQNAFERAPNDPDVSSVYGRMLLRDRDEKGADLVLKSIERQYSLKDPEYYLALNDAYYFTGDVTSREKLLKKAKTLDPGSSKAYVALSFLYLDMGQYGKGIQELEEVQKINPGFFWVIGYLAWLHYFENDLEKAAMYWSQYPEIESKFEDSTQNVGYRHRLGMVYEKMGRKKEADVLFAQELKMLQERLRGERGIGVGNNNGGTYYGLAVCNSYFGNQTKAVQYLDSALHYEFYWTDGYDRDPMFAEIRDHADFKKVIKKLDDYKEFMKNAYSGALNRMEASNELKNSLK